MVWASMFIQTGSHCAEAMSMLLPLFIGYVAAMFCSSREVDSLSKKTMNPDEPPGFLNVA